MTPVQILRTARTYLTDPNHWGQNSLYSYERVCAIGAINCAPIMDAPLTRERVQAMIMEAPQGGYFAFIASDERRQAMRYLRQVLGISEEYTSLLFRDVSHWNDADERTHADVLVAFDQAIILADADAIVAELEPLPVVVERELVYA